MLCFVTLDNSIIIPSSTTNSSKISSVPYFNKEYEEFAYQFHEEEAAELVAHDAGLDHELKLIPGE